MISSAHAAPLRSRDHDIAHFERAALHENRGDGPAALVELGFDDGAFSRTVGIRLEIEQFSLEQNRFLELVEICALGCRNFDGEHVAAHVFDLDFVLQQFRLHPHRIGVGFVDLVDRDDDRNACRFRVADRFDRLRHDAVIGGDDQHDEIGDFRTASAHGGERGVARRVEEGDLLARFHLHLIGADMLRDAAGFARDNIGLAQRVQQRCLAVIDVAHDGDHRRARLQRDVHIFGALQTFKHVGFGDALDGVAVFGSDEFGRVGVDHIVDLRHDAVLHQHFDDVDGSARHAIGEFGDGDRLGDRHFARTGGSGGLLLSGAVHALQMAAIGGDRTCALVVVGQRLGDGELASTARIGRLAHDGHLGHGLSGLLGCVRFLVFFDDEDGAWRGPFRATRVCGFLTGASSFFSSRRAASSSA